MSDRSIGCCEPHTWASVWLHVVTMSFRRKDRYEVRVTGHTFIPTYFTIYTDTH
ncbi:hypothetical protein Hanom_Chr11g01037581 [Helianthus anomalus]